MEDTPIVHTQKGIELKNKIIDAIDSYLGEIVSDERSLVEIYGILEFVKIHLLMGEFKRNILDPITSTKDE